MNPTADSDSARPITLRMSFLEQTDKWFRIEEKKPDFGPKTRLGGKKSDKRFYRSNQDSDSHSVFCFRLSGTQYCYEE